MENKDMLLCNKKTICTSLLNGDIGMNDVNYSSFFLFGDITAILLHNSLNYVLEIN